MTNLDGPRVKRRLFLKQLAVGTTSGGVFLGQSDGLVKNLDRFSSTSAIRKEQQRRQYLENLLQILPEVPAFNEWLNRTGELPPDFDALPRINDLPDPLKFFDGRPVRNAAEWRARRLEIGHLYQQYQLGTFPPNPKINRAILVDETRGKGYVIRNLRLEFGPQSKGTLRIRLIIPDGRGPFPVLMCNNLTGWGPALVRRYYISCGYAANDFMDDAASLAALYPEYTFARLPRRAWAAGVVLNYIETLPQVDRKRIGIYGYSRDGKVATIAAAFDERISAVIAGSTGVGGVLPWRMAGESRFAESIESSTRMFPSWFLMSLRFFCGREDRLPIDANLLVAMIAPRACLIEYGLNDQVSNAYGDERTYESALKVYKLLGHPERLSIFRLPGFHGANDEEADLDWLDIQFGRSNRVWNNDRMFAWNFDEWRGKTHEVVNVNRYPERGLDDILTGQDGTIIQSIAAWEAKAEEVRKSIKWMLGSEPPMMPPDTGESEFVKRFRARMEAQRESRTFNPGQVTPRIDEWVIQNGGAAYGWLEPQKSQTVSRSLNFGYNVRGDLYYPRNTNANAKLPVVIWLHGFSYPLGYMWVYHDALHPILALVQAGYAVLAYDQSGFGARMSEAGPFYERYPLWSHMGRLVEDVRTAIDALQSDALVDDERIYIFGYCLGGMVALYAAALDNRVRGLVSSCGFTPMRTDTLNKGTGGVARYCYQQGLIPRLGFFVGQERRIPYDFHEVMGAIAPRPLLVVEPLLDRDGDPADVRLAVEEAKKVYGLYSATENLVLWEPWDYNRLPNSLQDQIINWMRNSLK